MLLEVTAATALARPVPAINSGVLLSGLSVYEEIAQNVRTILMTVKGGVPLDRGFGISAELVDAPVSIARTRLTGELATQIAKYEPRAKLKQLKFLSGASETIDGELIVELEVGDNLETS